MDDFRYREAESAWWRRLGVRPEEHWVAVPRVGTKVRLQEVGDGPPILFLHGTTTAGACFADLATALRARHRCLLVDRPGCGLSEPTPDRPGVEDLDSFAEALVLDLLDELDLSFAHLVSSSMGGYYALVAAAARPERIDRIVHLGWSLGAPAHRLPLLMRLAARPGLGERAAEVRVTRWMAERMLHAAGLGAALRLGLIPEEAVDWNVALHNHTDTRRNEWELARGAPLPQMLADLELRPEILARVLSPTLILYGSEDPFGTVPTMRALADRLPHGRLEVIDGAGHAPWVHDVDGTAQRVAAFLAPAGP